MPQDVARELGFASTTVVPDEVAVAWPVWQELHPELRAVDAGDLREWLRRVPAGESDPVLLVLARRASPSGERDRVAALALVWCLLPGAQLVARRYHYVEGIDYTVAVQLWFQACEFCWQSKAKVAANIVRDVRYHVLRELRVSNRPDPSDRLNDTAVSYVDPVRGEAHDGTAASDVLLDLLDRAVERWWITRLDRRLLLEAVDVAREIGDDLRTSGELAGLASPQTCARVAERVGLSARLIRRRITEAIRALQRAVAYSAGEARDIA